MHGGPDKGSSGAPRCEPAPRQPRNDRVRVCSPHSCDPGLISEAFRTLHAEGAESGRVFSLPLHSWVIGQPHRIRYLAEALEDICSVGDVWQATAGEIARHSRSAAQGS